MIWDLFKYAVTNLRYRQLRSWLTVLGIVIGVAAIVALVAIGDGLQESVKKELEGFGSRNIIITPGSPKSTFSGGGSGFIATKGKLYEKDLEALKKVAGLERLSPAYLVRGATINFKDQYVSVNARGLEADSVKDSMPAIKIREGRFLQQGERGGVFVGSAIADTIFRKQKPGLGSVLTINGKKFRVVGVLEKSGSTGGTDNMVFMGPEDAKELLKDRLEPNEISGIYARLKEGADPSAVESDISFQLRSLHKVKEGEEDFTLITAKSISDQINTILGVITLAIGLVAAISLVVGAVGVANTMFMAVLERTREIGTLKAIGAPSYAILISFLFESALIGLAGGAIGILLGASAAAIVTQLGLTTSISPLIAIGAALFSILVGLAAGALPALNAARLDPVEALRYE